MKRERQTYEWKMGYDAGFHEPTTENCHFGLFSTPEKTKEWEMGNAQGKEDKKEAQQK